MASNNVGLEFTIRCGWHGRATVGIVSAWCQVLRCFCVYICIRSFCFPRAAFRRFGVHSCHPCCRWSSPCLLAPRRSSTRKRAFSHLLWVYVHVVLLCFPWCMFSRNSHLLLLLCLSSRCRSDHAVWFIFQIIVSLIWDRSVSGIVLMVDDVLRS